MKQLLCWGLSVIRENDWRTPVYLAVADYQGGVAPLLSDYGFAPFSDRVKMVKQVAKWVRETCANSGDSARADGRSRADIICAS